MHRSPERRLTRGARVVLASLMFWVSSAAWAAQPTVAQMLGYRPRQDGVNFTTPASDAVNACTVELVKGQRKGSGWLLKDGSKQPLRLFFDSNDDNKIDVWAYYRDGIEVYREIDSTYSGKPDQYRWLNTGGMKWGVDSRQDGKISYWKAISPEEVGQEALQAVIKKDFSKVEALLISESEIKDLGLPADMAAKFQEVRKDAQAKFQETVSKMPTLASGTVNWIHMESSRPPRCLPADQIGTRYDLIKHPGGTVACYVAGKNEWLKTGEMLQVGMAWRLIEVPTKGDNLQETEDPRPKGTGKGDVVLEGGSEKNPALMKLIEELTELDKKAPTSTNGGPDGRVVDHHLKRADLLEKIIALVPAQQREPWIRQVGDSLSTAAGASAKGETTAMTRLLSLEHQLVSKMPGSNLAAYVTFREMQTEYSIKIVENKDFTKIQQEWLERLSKYIQTYPKAEDTPDALLQAGMVSEFLDKEVEAKNWYIQLKKNFPTTAQAKKAGGAIERLESEGKPFKLAGPMLNDTNQPFDIAELKNKITIVYYWAAWNSQSVGDFAKLKQLLDTHGKKGVELVCVNLDSTVEEAKEFLASKAVAPAPGIHLHQPGGLDSNLATSYGIMVLPNAFVIDRQGNMANRKIQMNSLKEEVEKQLLK